MNGQVAELKTRLTTERQRAATVDRLLDDKAFALAADPTLSSGPPDRESEVPTLDFTPLDNAVARLTASARAYDDAVEKTPDAVRAAQVNAILQGAEQALTEAAGLPGRPWYKHLIYAPGLLTATAPRPCPACVKRSRRAGGTRRATVSVERRRFWPT